MTNTTTTASPPAARSLHEVCEAARQANCGECWALPGRPCTVAGPPGDHLARWMRAERRGLISREHLAAVVAGLEVIAAHVMIRGRCPVTGLSAQDRHEIDMARQLAALATVATVREHVGTDDTVIALAHFWGAARVSLDSVAAVAERLGGTEDRCLREIRDLFSRFDWEHDDRQYALEAIERIVNEGGTDGD